MRSDALFVTIAPWPAIALLGVVLRPSSWTGMAVAGLAILATGLVLLTVSRVQLGNAFSAEPRATTLVTHGLYARIRNPVYVFGIVVLGGFVLYVQLPWLLLALVPLAALQVSRARREAKVLEDAFGDAYRAWRAQTWF
jgi:protein-S-isoprenylcysteine O-methyltransferase Ste14